MTSVSFGDSQFSIDNKQLGFTLSALAEVTLTRHTARAAREFIKAIQSKQQVIACHMVTGDCDFVLRIMSPGIDAYRKLIWEELHGIEGVLKIRSSVIMETFKDQLSPILDDSSCRESVKAASSIAVLPSPGKTRKVFIRCRLSPDSPQYACKVLIIEVGHFISPLSTSGFHLSCCSNEKGHFSIGWLLHWIAGRNMRPARWKSESNAQSSAFRAG